MHEPGPVYAFVPAHGDSKAGAVQEHLGRTWSEGFGLAVLLVDFASGRANDEGFSECAAIRREDGMDRCTFQGTEGRAIRKLVASAKSNYEVICVDLTGAPQAAAKAILDLAHSVFLVSDSGRESLIMARATIAKLRPFKMEDRLALLLRRTTGGLRPDLAEDLAGAPVCGLVETVEQLERLARWLVLPQPAFAIAV
jgi:Flp pilus assembly CpaE family ATPase